MSLFLAMAAYAACPEHAAAAFVAGASSVVDRYRAWEFTAIAEEFVWTRTLAPCVDRVLQSHELLRWYLAVAHDAFVRRDDARAVEAFRWALSVGAREEFEVEPGTPLAGVVDEAVRLGALEADTDGDGLADRQDVAFGVVESAPPTPEEGPPLSVVVAEVTPEPLHTPTDAPPPVASVTQRRPSPRVPLVLVGAAVALSGGGFLVGGRVSETTVMADPARYDGDEAQAYVNRLYGAGYALMGAGMAVGGVGFLAPVEGGGVLAWSARW